MNHFSFKSLLLVPLVALLFAFAGCGGDDDSTTTTPAAGEAEGAPGVLSDEVQAQLEELRQCVEDEGVDLPDPNDPNAIDPTDPDPKLIEALQACQEFIPQGPAGDAGAAPPAGDGG